jgi:hypothetical protein
MLEGTAGYVELAELWAVHIPILTRSGSLAISKCAVRMEFDSSSRKTPQGFVIFEPGISNP